MGEKERRGLVKGRDRIEGSTVLIDGTVCN